MFPQLPWLTPWKRLATILANNVNDAAEMLIVQGGANFRINVAQLKALLGGGGSGATTIGQVSGLTEELAGKAGTSGEGVDASAFRTALGIDSLNIVDAVPVANQTARLALSASAARNVLVKEADTGRSYMLIAGGTPSNNGDWILFSDITPAVADVTGLVDLINEINSLIEALQTGKANASSVLPLQVWSGPEEVSETIYANEGSPAIFRINTPLAGSTFYGAISLPGTGLSVVEYTSDKVSPEALSIIGPGVGVMGTLSDGEVAICFPDGSGGLHMTKLPSSTGQLALQSSVDLLDAEIEQTKPAAAAEAPSSAPLSMGLEVEGDGSEFNGNYSDVGLTMGDLPVFVRGGLLDPSTGISQLEHFFWAELEFFGAGWFMQNSTGTIVARSNTPVGDGIYPWDFENWDDGTGTPISWPDSLSQVFNAGEYTVPEFLGQVLVHDDFVYRAVSTAPVIWRKEALGGQAFNSRLVEFGSGAQLTGSLKFLLSGTTVPSTSALVLSEAPQDFLTPVGIWTSDGEWNSGTPPASGVWVALERVLTNNGLISTCGLWNLSVYNNGILSQQWQAFVPDEKLGPDTAIDWYQLSGAASAGPVLTRQLTSGMPGYVGENYSMDTFELGINGAEHYVCIQDYPYNKWIQVPTKADVDAKLNKDGSGADPAFLQNTGVTKQGLRVTDGVGDGSLSPKDALGFYTLLGANLYGKQGFVYGDTTLPGWYGFLDEGANRWTIDFLYEGVMTNMGWQADEAIADIADDDGSMTWSALGTHSAGGTLSVLPVMVAIKPEPATGHWDYMPVKPGGLDELIFLSQRRRHCGGLGSNTSALGGEAATTSGEFSTNASTSANAWARARLARNLTSFSGVTGAGISCANDIDVAGIMMVGLQGGGKVRIVVGDDGTAVPPIATANALTSRGWGFEIFNSTGTSISARLFCHDGTSYDFSTDALITPSAYGGGTNIPFILRKEGGRLTLLLGAGYTAGQTPTPAVLPVIRLDDTAPTTGSTTGGYISMLSVNPNAAVTSCIGRMHGELITDIRK